MILLIGGEKGGTGKSTLAKNIAAYLQQQGKEIITIDADPQGTLYRWATRRKDNQEVQPILCTQLIGSKIANELRSLSTKYDVVLIDAGGQDSGALRAAMVVATHLLIPVQPKFSDLETLPHVAEILDELSHYNPHIQYRTVITMCPTLPSQAKDVIDAKDFCQSIGIPSLNAITHHRVVYDNVNATGLTAFESDNTKAQQEITEIVQEFLGV